MNYEVRIQKNLSKYLDMSKEQIAIVPRKDLIDDLFFLGNLQMFGETPVEDIERAKIYIELCRRDGKDPLPSLKKQKMLENSIIKEFL